MAYLILSILIMHNYLQIAFLHEKKTWKSCIKEDKLDWLLQGENYQLCHLDVRGRDKERKKNAMGDVDSIRR